MTSCVLRHVANLPGRNVFGNLLSTSPNVLFAIASQIASERIFLENNFNIEILSFLEGNGT